MKSNPLRKEFPMVNYLESWKLFRSLSNENIVTAKAIIKTKKWNSPHNILDIGSGDGRLLKEILTASNAKGCSSYLVDPEPLMMEQAKENLQDLSNINKFHFIEKDIFEIKDLDRKQFNAILAVHFAYLVPFETFRTLFSKLPSGIPLYLVIDNINSVFSRIWEFTAPKYAKRSAQTHNLIGSLNSNHYEVASYQITSSIKNPYHLKFDQRDSVLSLISYSNIDVVNTEISDQIRLEISKSIINDEVVCESVCYEIIKK